MGNYWNMQNSLYMPQGYSNIPTWNLDPKMFESWNNGSCMTLPYGNRDWSYYNPSNTTLPLTKSTTPTTSNVQNETYDEKISRLLNGSITGTEDKVSMTSFDRQSLKKNQKEASANATQEAQGSALGAYLGTLPFAAPAIYSGCKAYKKPDVVKMFLEFENGSAKYAQLYKDAPETMQQAQKVMQKVHNKYLSDLKSAVGDDVLTNQIKNDYAGLEKMMKNALKSGKADNVAKATARLEGSFGSTLKTRFVSQAGKRTAMARAVDTSAVKAVNGTKFNIKNIFGGKTAMALSAVMAVGMYFLSEKGKVDSAYSIDEETGKKQRNQSLWRLVGSFLAFDLGQGLGKIAVSKLLSKSVGKLAAKVAAKGLGKVVGTAVGSIIPGAGTIVGLAIGTAFDLLVSKVIIPAIFGKDDAVNVATIDKKTDEDLVSEAYIKKLKGETLTKVEQRVIENNPSFCGKLDAQIQQELLLQQQMAQQQAQNKGVQV